MTMAPEQMTAALLRIVDRAEREKLDKVEADLAAKKMRFPATPMGVLANGFEDSERKRATGHAARTRNDIPPWVNSLHAARLKVSKPKVLRVRGQYGASMSHLEDGLFVAAQAVIHFDIPGRDRVRVFDMKELVGWGHSRSRLRIPLLGVSFHLGLEEEKLLEQDSVLCASIALLVDPLVAEAEAAFKAARAQSTELIRSFRDPVRKDEERVLAGKLQPFLKDNPLAELSPAALALIFKTPWKELERIVSFLKGNAAMAGGVTEESMDHIKKLMVAHEIMDS